MFRSKSPAGSVQIQVVQRGITHAHMTGPVRAKIGSPPAGEKSMAPFSWCIKPSMSIPRVRDGGG